MPHQGRTRNAAASTDRLPCLTEDVVACAAGAFVVSLNDDPVIDIIDADDSLMYQAEICDDCGNDKFNNNACMCCGSIAPWAAKLGCGLA